MAHAIAICSSIEAEKIELKTRKFNSSPPTIDEESNEMRWGFQLGMNSCAWIGQPYASPKDSVVFKTSMLEAGDMLTGATIDGWSRKPLGPPNVKKGSGTHSATFVSIKGGCYAHIQSPAREHLNDPKMESKIRAVEQTKKKPATVFESDSKAKDADGE